MLESFEHKGFWWVPSYSGEKVPGVLKYSMDNGITLELIGHFSLGNKFKILIDVDCYPPLEVINGKLYDGRLITLLDCQISECKTGTIMSLPTFKCVSMIIGPVLFTKKADVRFRQVVASIQYLNDWLGLNSAFHIEYQPESSGCKIEYNKPDAINLQLGTHYQLSFSPCLRFSDYISNNKATIEQNFNLCVSQACLEQYDDLISKVRCFQNLLVLFVQKFPSLLRVTFYKNTEDKVQDRFEYYCRQDVTIGAHNKLHWFEMILDYQTIAPSFNQIVSKWYNEYKGLENIYIPYFHSFSKDLNFIDTYLNICRAIEAFGRHCKVQAGDEPNPRKCNLLQAVVYLHGKYNDTMNIVLFVKDIHKFAKKLTNHRNRLTHANPITSELAKNFQEVYDIIEQLKAFLTIALLRYHGVSSETLNDSLNISHVYSYLKLKKEKEKEKEKERA